MSKKAGAEKAGGGATYVRVQDKRVKLTHLDKVLYPEIGFTKAQVIDYYASVEKVIVPHLKDRALTLKRYPDGVDEEFFYGLLPLVRKCITRHPEVNGEVAVR